MTGKFEVYQDKSGKFLWRLTHVNGLVLAKSRERYTNKVTAIKDIWGALAVTSNR